MNVNGIGFFMAHGLLLRWMNYEDHPFAASPLFLFVLRDAGETLALLPVMRYLRVEKNCLVRGLVTGYGTAPASILSEPGVTSLAALGQATPALQSRNATLPRAAIDDALNATLGHAHAVVVVAGVVSAVQLQLARASLARREVGLVAGLDDSLSDDDQLASWPRRALSSHSVQELWTVSELTAGMPGAQPCRGQCGLWPPS